MVKINKKSYYGMSAKGRRASRRWIKKLEAAINHRMERPETKARLQKFYMDSLIYGQASMNISELMKDICNEN